MKWIVGRMAASLGILLLCGSSAMAQDQAYPSRRVTLIVPFGAGGSTDWMARTLGDYLQRKTGQPFIIDNRPGGNGMVGLQALLRNPPDGYTFIHTITALAAVPVFVKNPPVDIEHDITGVGSTAYVPYVIIANSEVPVKTMPEFVSYARANPGKLNYGVVAGTVNQLFIMDLIRRTGIQMAVIPYKGQADAERSLMANETQFYIAGPQQNLTELVKAGRLRYLAVTSTAPLKSLPDLPTVKAALNLDVDAFTLFCFSVAAATPKPIISRLSALISDATRDPEMAAKIRTQGLEPYITTPEELNAVMAREIRRDREIAKAAGIQPE